MLTNQNSINRLRLLILGGAFLLSSAASASLIGDTIQISLILDGDPEGTVEVTVGDGVEVPGGSLGLDPDESIDISGDMITVVTTGPFPSNSRYIFSDLDWLPLPGSLLDITVETTGDIVGLDRDDFVVTADSITAEAGDDAFSGAGTVFIGLITEHEEPLVDVPQPASLSLAVLGIGLTVLSWLTRRRQR